MQRVKDRIRRNIDLTMLPSYDGFLIGTRVAHLTSGNRRSRGGVGSLGMGYELLRLHRPGSLQDLVNFLFGHTLPAVSSYNIQS